MRQQARDSAQESAPRGLIDPGPITTGCRRARRGVTGVTVTVHLFCRGRRHGRGEPCTVTVTVHLLRRRVTVTVHLLRRDDDIGEASHMV